MNEKVTNRSVPNNVLVVAAHSDDEVLGCGGTLLKHRDLGDHIHLIFLTDGVGSRGSDKGSKSRFIAAQRVQKALGARSLLQLEFPDNQLDTVSLLKIVKEIEYQVGGIEPDIIYTHHAGDLNVDHRICREAVQTSLRPLPNTKFTAIYGFEVQSSTEWSQHVNFVPNYYVDITNHLEEKKKLLSFYKDEMRKFPHPRSIEAIEAQAKWRGAASGCFAAEAFSTIFSKWY